MRDLIPFFIIWFATLTRTAGQNASDFTQENFKPFPIATTNETVSGVPTNLVIQLAVIGDLDFSTLFENDLERMLEYWKLVLHDVHLRYQTLPGFNISFQITSFRVIKRPVPFIEKFRNEQGHLDVRKVLRSMEDWLGPQVGNLPSFDIALLATGALAHDSIAVGRQSSICLGNSIPGKWISNVAVSVRATDVAGLVAHIIGHVLGAPYDDEKSYLQHDCGTYSTDKEETFLMSDDAGYQRHFFSNCTNKILTSRFKKLPPNCLIPTVNENNVGMLYDSASRIPGTVSILEQCRIQTNATVIAKKERFDGDFCDWVECQIVNPLHNVLETQYIRPLDGSLCGNFNGRCFRGFCVPPVVNLVNVANGKCLNVQDLQSKLTRKECSYGVNLLPTDLTTMLSNQIGGVYFMKRFAAKDEHGISQKCLTLDDENVLTLDICDSASRLDWNLEKVDTQKSATVFMIRHKRSNTCLKAKQRSDAVVASWKCDKGDASTHWTLVLGNGTTLTHFNYKECIQRPVVIVVQRSLLNWPDILLIPGFAVLFIQLKLQRDDFRFARATGSWRYCFDIITHVITAANIYFQFIRDFIFS